MLVIQEVLPVKTFSWCVMKTDGTFLECTPNRLSEIMPDSWYSLIHFLTIFFSSMMAVTIFGEFFSIFHLKLLPFLAYSISYDGKESVSRFGNSFFKISNASPSDAIMGLYPNCTKALMMGMQRVAWPSPQFRGATRIFCVVVNV